MNLLEEENLNWILEGKREKWRVLLGGKKEESSNSLEVLMESDWLLENQRSELVDLGGGLRTWGQAML